MDGSATDPGGDRSTSLAAAVVVFTGGDPPDPGVAAFLPDGALVVAADSGADHAAALGLAVDLLVGDLDSSSAAARVNARQLVRALPDKDATDLEIALAVAAERAAPGGRIVLVGGRGGRLDHELTTLATLAGPLTSGHRVEAWLGSALTLVARDEVTTDVRPGELVSLIPVHGRARGVTTTGLRWALTEGTLEAGTTWGVSNEALASRATVGVGDGVVLVVRPHALDPAADRPPVPDRPRGEPTAPVTPAPRHVTPPSPDPIEEPAP